MTTTTCRPACPVCSAEAPDASGVCTECGTDQRLFSPVKQIALDFYNAGIDLARAGDRPGAIEKMRGALAADPSLVDVHIVLGKLHAQAGDAAELEAAIECWNRAKSLEPSTEQAARADDCIRAATASIVLIRKAQYTRRRVSALAYIAGGVAAAAVCGAAGFGLKSPSRFMQALTHQPAQRSVLASRSSQRGTSGTAGAISDALKRPDIVVARIGDKYALNGTVGSDAEKSVILAAAAYAVNARPGSIDGAGLLVGTVKSGVAAQRVEHMLRIFVNSAAGSSDSPLRGAQLSVSGGAGSAPLVVSGKCASAKAGDEISRLVHEIYPSANAVDTSKLIATDSPAVLPDSARLATAGPAHAVRHSVAAAPRAGRTARNAGDQIYINLSTRTYTVQPGDTIVAIAHKYGKDNSEWQQLWQNNRQTVRSPNAVTAGTVLKLPAGWKSAKQPNDENE